MHCPVSIATSVAIGIKSVCHHATESKCVVIIIWSVKLTSGIVLLSDLQAVFIYQNMIAMPLGVGEVPLAQASCEEGVGIWIGIF